MTYLDTLKKLAQAAIAEDTIPSANLPVYNFRQHRDAYRVATQPERILQLVEVIEAAKAMRDVAMFGAYREQATAFDAAIRALK